MIRTLHWPCSCKRRSGSGTGAVCKPSSSSSSSSKRQHRDGMAKGSLPQLRSSRLLAPPAMWCPAHEPSSNGSSSGSSNNSSRIPNSRASARGAARGRAACVTSCEAVRRTCIREGRPSGLGACAHPAGGEPSGGLCIPACMTGLTSHGLKLSSCCWQCQPCELCGL